MTPFNHLIHLWPGLEDIVIMNFYLVMAILFGLNIKNKNISEKKYYSFYVWGVLVSVGGAISLCLLYLLAYGGGDTTEYFRGSLSMVKFLAKEPWEYFKLLIGIVKRESRFMFDATTGVPWQISDYNAFTVVRLSSIFVFLGANNFFTASLLVGWFSFSGKWALYKLFCEHYPKYYKSIAFGILFYPSIVFWGSGILKDTYTLASIGWFLYNFYAVFIKKEYNSGNIVLMLIGGWLILTIKPYVFVALTPGVLIWLSFNRLKKINNPVWRLLSAPLITILFAGFGLIIINVFGSYLGPYGDLDSIILKAQVTQDDMMRAHAYSENYFDIGRLDGSLGNFLSKIPAASIAGLFRPFLWDVRNFLMLLAGLENTFLLGMVFIILWRIGPIKGLKIISDEPLIGFSLLFALIFAFAVGVSTANFGALVRLRIPLLPFLVSALIIMLHRSLEIKKERENKQAKSFSLEKK